MTYRKQKRKTSLWKEVIIFELKLLKNSSNRRSPCTQALCQNLLAIVFLLELSNEINIINSCKLWGFQGVDFWDVTPCGCLRNRWCHGILQYKYILEITRVILYSFYFERDSSFQRIAMSKFEMYVTWVLEWPTGKEKMRGTIWKNKYK
jgi:hypothetical protein